MVSNNALSERGSQIKFMIGSELNDCKSVQNQLVDHASSNLGSSGGAWRLTTKCRARTPRLCRIIYYPCNIIFLLLLPDLSVSMLNAHLID